MNILINDILQDSDIDAILKTPALADDAEITSIDVAFSDVAPIDPMPELPDGGGASYFQDTWATVDGWADDGGCTVSVYSGQLVLTSTASGPICATKEFVSPLPSGFVFARVKAEENPVFNCCRNRNW